MDVKKYRKMTMETVIAPMLDLIREYGAEDYTRADVRKCKRIIYRYLSALSSIKNVTNEKIMEQVKTVVIALNELNESVDYALIETGEREAIYEIIQYSAIDCGLTDAPDDITEEWRDW